MSSRTRTWLAIGVCVVVALVALGFVGRSRGWYGQSDLEKYRPSPEALRKMEPDTTYMPSPPPPGGYTPYGLPPKPGEIRPPPSQSSSYD